MNKIFNEKYHCLACELSRNYKISSYCICQLPDLIKVVMSKFPKVVKEVEDLNKVISFRDNTSIALSVYKDPLAFEIVNLTIEKSNKYESYQKAIDEVSAILRVLIQMRPSQKDLIHKASELAADEFLTTVQKVQSDSSDYIQMVPYARPNDLEIPGGPIIGNVSITQSRPKLTI